MHGMYYYTRLMAPDDRFGEAVRSGVLTGRLTDSELCALAACRGVCRSGEPVAVSAMEVWRRCPRWADPMEPNRENTLKDSAPPSDRPGINP